MRMLIESSSMSSRACEGPSTGKISRMSFKGENNENVLEEKVKWRSEHSAEVQIEKASKVE